MSDDRRYGPRRLASLLLRTTSRLPAEHGNVWIQGLTADSRAVGPGMLFAALPGTKSDGAKFIPQAVEAGAAAILTGQPVAARRVHDPGHPGRRPAPRAGACRRALLRPTAAHRRGGDRHQRQDLGHASSCGRSGRRPGTRPRASARSASSPRAARSNGQPDHARSGPAARDLADLAGDDVTHLALEASSHGLEQRRLDGVRLRGRRLHQSVARPPRLPPHARRLPAGQAAPVRHAAAEGRGGGRRRRPARGGEDAAHREGRASSNLSASAAHGETLKLVSVTRMHDGVAAPGRGVRREALRGAAAGRRVPDLQCAGRRRARDRDRRRGR